MVKAKADGPAVWISARRAASILGIPRGKAMDLVRGRRFTTKITPGRLNPQVLEADVRRLACASILPAIAPTRED